MSNWDNLFKLDMKDADRNNKISRSMSKYRDKRVNDGTDFCLSRPENTRIVKKQNEKNRPSN